MLRLGCRCSVAPRPHGSRGAQELAFLRLFGGSHGFWEQWGKWLQPSLAGERMSFPWAGRRAAAATDWLELPLEKPKRACWLVAPSVGYLRHRLELFSVPRKQFFLNSSRQ